MTLLKWNFHRMKTYQLSNKATEDLHQIASYTKTKFGDLQAKAYLTGLTEIVAQLVGTPSLAHKIPDIRQEYRRYLFQKHAIYFKETEYGIYIVRILHQQMNISLHLQ